MQKILAMLATVTLLAGLSGCSYVFYPRVDDYAEKQKGVAVLELC